MRCQGLHVFRPLSKRRHVQVDDAQPVQKVFAKLAGRNKVGQLRLVAATTRTSTRDWA